MTGKRRPGGRPPHGTAARCHLTAVVLALLWATAAAGSLAAQSDLSRERAEYTAWLTTAPTSPRAALALQPIGPGLRLGPADADVPLEGVAMHRVVAGGAIRLESAAGSRVLPRGRSVSLGRYVLRVDGPPGREVLAVFGPLARAEPPHYYDPSPAFSFIGPLDPPVERATVPALGLDGIEVAAAEAGSVLVPLGGGRVRLRVRRLPSPGGEESELQIFFRDGTSGHGSYPAGRFVTLVPVRDGKYRLDFNRARNPFCAYSSAYPCPAPWNGNTIPIPVTAGEQYRPREVADSAAPSSRRP
ncbi:MAG TPA: DUF1684 domain-containing protein [Gemmatimonadales bacterium]|nr:DUF1684 domain-containing protein [Gemmatimonadales bacterium]